MEHQPRFILDKQKLTFGFFIIIPFIVSNILPYFFIKTPFFIKYRHFTMLNSGEIHLALIASILWATIFLITISLSKFNFKKNIKASESPTRWLGLILLLIGLLAHTLIYFLKPHGTLADMLFFLTLSSTLSLVVFTYHLPTQKNNLFFVLINAAIIIFFSLASASAHAIAYSAVAVAYSLHQRTNLKQKCLLALLCVTLIATCMIARSFIRVLYSSSPSERQLTTLTQTTVTQVKDYPRYFSEGSIRTLPFFKKYTKYAQEMILQRINHLAELAYVMKVTPNKISYLNGYTYKQLPYIFVPSLIDKNKPKDTTSSFYGKRYGFIDSLDNKTSWAPTMIGEAYVNFGWIGIILSAVILGLLLRAIFSWVIVGTETIRGILLATAFVIVSSQLESDAVILFGNIVHLACYYFIFYIMITYVAKSKLSTFLIKDQHSFSN